MADIWINYTNHVGVDTEETFDTEEDKAKRVMELINQGINPSSSSIPEPPEEEV